MRDTDMVNGLLTLNRHYTTDRCRPPILVIRSSGASASAVPGPCVAALLSDSRSDDRIGKILHRRDEDVGLVRRDAERPAPPVDEGGSHASGLGADAVKRMIGDEQDLI